MDDWDIIYSYTRAQAIEDGALIPVDSELGRETGFKIPIALTSTLYEKYIKSDLPGQDEKGRLFDVLFLLHLKASNCESSLLYFKVGFLMNEDLVEEVCLQAVIGSGDKIEDGPVLTIMLLDED